MIEAKQNKLAHIIFDPYLKRLLRKNFSNFFLVNEFPKLQHDARFIVTPNHFSWWDGFFVDHLFKIYTSKKLYILMLEEQLKKYWFFKYLGAFSISPKSAKSVIESADYAKQILENPNNFLVFYPQGKIEPFDISSINLQRGLKYFIPANSTTIILPIALTIQYYGNRLPEVYVRFGDILSGEVVLNDYELYVNAFKENLEQLSFNANRRNFIKDLFV